MPDLASKIGELFNVELPGLFVSSWKKAKEVREALEESRKSPDEVIVLELAQHEITNEFNPYIEIRVAAMPVPKKSSLKWKLRRHSKGSISRSKPAASQRFRRAAVISKEKLNTTTSQRQRKNSVQFELLGVSTRTKQQTPPR
jgi:hypothetical protein